MFFPGLESQVWLHFNTKICQVFIWTRKKSTHVLPATVILRTDDCHLYLLLLGFLGTSLGNLWAVRIIPCEIFKDVLFTLAMHSHAYYFISTQMQQNVSKCCIYGCVQYAHIWTLSKLEESIFLITLSSALWSSSSSILILWLLNQPPPGNIPFKALWSGLIYHWFPLRPAK